MHAARFYGTVVVCVLGLTGATARAVDGDLHFVVLADTNDPTIGTVDDLANAADWAATIASYTGLTLRLESLSGDDLTVDSARSLLAGLEVTSDDVVYFFYSGHGYNPGGRKWPVLAFTGTVLDDDVSLDEVVETLEAKSPRLLVVLADCCNNYPEPAARRWPRWRPRPSDALEHNFRALFLQFAGTVIASGSSPGQYSLGAEGVGGLFINMFMNAVVTLGETETDLTWAEALAKTADDTLAIALGNVDELGDPDPIEQEPQYEIVPGEVVAGATEDLLDDDDDQVGDGQLTDDTGGGDDQPVDDAGGSTGDGVPADGLPPDGLVDPNDMEEVGPTPRPACGLFGGATLALTAAEVGALRRRK